MLSSISQARQCELVVFPGVCSRKKEKNALGAAGTLLSADSGEAN